VGGKGSGDKPHLIDSTSKKKEAFLLAFAEMGVIKYACEKAGIDRATYYYWRTHDENFFEAAGRAQEIAADSLEQEARRRAVEGVEEPVFYQGERVATVKKYSDTLLMFLLNGEKPDKFARRVKQDTTLNATVNMNTLSDDELDAKLAALGGEE